MVGLIYGKGVSVETKEEEEKQFMENHRRDVISYADVVRMGR